MKLINEEKIEKTNCIVKVNWSGGKDSTASVLLHIKRGDYVKVVCYIPRFTKDIPLISKEHYQFLLDTADKFRKMGAEVYFAEGIPYNDWSRKIITMGKNKGRPFGFPPFKAGMCNFKNYSKMKALNTLDIGKYDYEDIGIAFDEPRRFGNLKDNRISILVELEMTEKDAWKLCEDNGVLSPNYVYNKRDGCALCPHAKVDERIRWYNDYPEALELVKDLQEFVKIYRPEQTPLRYYQWFIDDKGELH